MGQPMKIRLIALGKIDQSYLKQGIEEFAKRLVHFARFDVVELPSIKQAGNLPIEDLKKREALRISKHLHPSDVVVLLDEGGKQLSSVAFASFLSQQTDQRNRQVVFIIGGAFGVHPSLYDKATHILSLSTMTFPHQLVRLIFLEQLYRACTIVKGIPYHNE